MSMRDEDWRTRLMPNVRREYWITVRCAVLIDETFSFAEYPACANTRCEGVELNFND